ncbi:MAG: SUMF1/EgtB/PvdO family nonheme iron enzyme [Anaerolineae bacterium]|nr:SUMF1/EgtB/PvdO family nonheme iron enzyme [Anaerolineae bacterium]
MKLFISYARVDKPYCIQIAEMLDIHSVWYDQRLYAGQNWWREILRRLDWCEGFIYLLSPDSVASQYCRDEYLIATRLNKIIFPVLIDANTRIPEPLRQLQYADLSSGLTVQATRQLLNAIYRMEKDSTRSGDQSISINKLGKEEIAPPTPEPSTIIGRAAEAMEQNKFDQAVFLLRQAKEKGFKSRYWNIDDLLAQAEDALTAQTRDKEVRLEYQTIKELITRKISRKTGCEALQSFLRDHPDYDPDHLGRLCSGDAPVTILRVVPDRLNSPRAQSGLTPGAPIDLPLLDWVTIPAGTTHDVAVDSFTIARYPVTNEQFQRFVDDPEGYKDARWWTFSPYAVEWHKRNLRPRPSRFKGDTLPRESVCWFEAMAFCQWLGAKMDCPVTLPTVAQWRRAASGDDNRIYPWGDTFDANKCNVRESRIRQTTSVIRYPDGASPFGVCDLSGNVWEWCLDSLPEEPDHSVALNLQRAVLGGAFLTASERARTTFNFHLDPEYYYGTIGFRVAMPA